ncbi:MAG: type IX secretion system motor protein PorM/GldM [Flavisolibacter sp.]
MALPKEPRQKMINLMYLVLTALLALNVSAEILNAFKIVDNSLRSTNNTINHSTETILESLKEKMSEGPTAEKAKIWFPKAQQAQLVTADAFNYVKALRDTILKRAGFDPAKKGDSTFNMEDRDMVTRVMVEEGLGKKLYDKLAEYKKNLLGIDPLIKEQFENNLQIDLTLPETQDKGLKTWEDRYFHMVPSVAVLTMLSKFQNDIKASENKVVAFCHEQVGKVTVRFDTYAAVIGQSSNYVMPGQDIEITAGVGAFSKAAQPQISINGQGAALGEDGASHVKFPGGGIGNHSVPIHIVYKDQDGKEQVIDKTITYTVGQANASIALDKMNVLYIGVDNPVTIAASGGGDDKVQVSMNGGGGSINRVGAGKYIVRVNSVTDDAKITVSVDGKVAGVSQFRVRTIPDPVATVGGNASGDNINAGAFKAQAGVGAYIKDFPFDLKYSVTSFSLSIDNDEGDVETADCTGNGWSTKAQGMISRLVKPGRLVTIDAIRAQGPDGRTRKLPSLVYYIK